MHSGTASRAESLVVDESARSRVMPRTFWQATLDLSCLQGFVLVIQQRLHVVLNLWGYQWPRNCAWSTGGNDSSTHGCAKRVQRKEKVNYKKRKLCGRHLNFFEVVAWFSLFDFGLWRKERFYLWVVQKGCNLRALNRHVNRSLVRYYLGMWWVGEVGARLVCAASEEAREFILLHQTIFFPLTVINL